MSSTVSASSSCRGLRYSHRDSSLWLGRYSCVGSQDLNQEQMSRPERICFPSSVCVLLYGFREASTLGYADNNRQDDHHYSFPNRYLQLSRLDY